MEFGIFEMYIMIAITLIFIIILKRDSQKYAETNNITKLDQNEDGTRREYIASGVTDYSKSGSKLLIIIYSIFCRNCDSTNIFAEISEDKEHIQLTCRDCGYNTLIPLKKMFIHERLDDALTEENEEELVKRYIHKVQTKHEVDIEEPDDTSNKK